MNIRIANLNDTETLLKRDEHISKQEIKNLISLNRIYICEHQKCFIGWLRYNLFWDNTPFMNMIYILDKYRRNGFGKELVLFWENNMKRLGYKSVMTSTVSNEYAQHFYNKLGYAAIGGFIPQNQLYEIILEKSL